YSNGGCEMFACSRFAAGLIGAIDGCLAVLATYRVSCQFPQFRRMASASLRYLFCIHAYFVRHLCGFSLSDSHAPGTSPQGSPLSAWRALYRHGRHCLFLPRDRRWIRLEWYVSGRLHYGILAGACYQFLLLSSAAMLVFPSRSSWRSYIHNIWLSSLAGIGALLG